MTSAARDRESIARETSATAVLSALRAAPFEADPDPRFVYPHAGLQRVCAELLAFDLSERPGLLLITGAAGTGKSVLLRSLVEDRRLGGHCHLLSCAGDLSFEALVKAWCAALRIATRAKAHETRLAALTAHLAARHKQAGTPTLLLDDAETLDDHALEQLCGLAGAGVADRRQSRIILAARPELDDRLARPELAPLAQAISFRSRLEAVNEAEVEAYIRHRLAAAGCEAPDETFSAPAVEVAARASLGVPRLINVLCRTALAIAEAGGQATISAAQIEAAIQACLLHVQDPLAAQGDLPLPEIPAAGAGTVASKPAPEPVPPRPQAQWPIVVEFDAAADEVSRSDEAADRWQRRLLRTAPGLLAGLLFGLAVVTLYPVRLQMPGAVPPGLLLSAEDEKARLIEGGPADSLLEPPVEKRAPEAEPAVLDLELWLETPAIQPEPAVLAPEPEVETGAPEAEPAILEREPWIDTPEIEAEPDSPIPEPSLPAPAIEAEPAVPPPEPSAETRVREAKPAVPALEPPIETRATEPAPAPLAPEPQAETRKPDSQPAVPAPKPRVKPRLLPLHDKPAAAAPMPEASETEAEPEPTSWLGRLNDLFSSARPSPEARNLERYPDR